MTKKLQPTYGNFTLRGQVVWKDRPNAYVEDTSANGFLYRRIRFGVKTAEKNIVEVELFATKFDEVSLQNIETKKLDKRVPYGEHTGELPEGYRLFMPVNLGLLQNEEGENIKERLISFDAVKYINDNLKNGETVFIFGSPRFSEYEKDGDVTPQVTFEPRGIYKSTIDYDEEEFEGQSTFDQQIVLNRTEKQGDKLYVYANIITDKKGNFVSHRFVIDINKFKKFAMNVHRLKFGTLLSVEGLINHTVKEKEVEITDDWGESPVKDTITNIIKELEITVAQKPKKEDISFYSQDDFVKKKEEDEKPEDNPFSNDDSDDDWGASASEVGNSDDPFADDFGFD